MASAVRLVDLGSPSARTRRLKAWPYASINPAGRILGKDRHTFALYGLARERLKDAKAHLAGRASLPLPTCRSGPMIPPMAETWFFHMEGRDVVLLAWATGPGGIIGSGFHNVEPGGSVLNLSYDELAAAVAGRVVIENGVARIETHHARLPGA